jgi:hypothetical protein
LQTLNDSVAKLQLQLKRAENFVSGLQGLFSLAAAHIYVRALTESQALLAA